MSALREYSRPPVSDPAKYLAWLLIDTHRRFGWRAEREVLFDNRRADVVAIAPGGAEVIGFEIKVSVQDFRLEMRQPRKRGDVMKFCTQFYFVVPLGLLPVAKFPSECGVLFYEAGRIHLGKPFPGRKSESVFETEAAAIEFEEWRAEVMAAEGPADDYLPAWMLPRFHRPLRFQFDVAAAAAKIPSFQPCDFNLDAGMEAF